jgi:hypothetical protein
MDTLFPEVLRFAADGYVKQPLWDFPPAYRLQVIHERRVRFAPLMDDEPAGDPIYS